MADLTNVIRRHFNLPPLPTPAEQPINHWTPQAPDGGHRFRVLEPTPNVWRHLQPSAAIDYPPPQTEVANDQFDWDLGMPGTMEFCPIRVDASQFYTDAPLFRDRRSWTASILAAGPQPGPTCFLRDLLATYLLADVDADALRIECPVCLDDVVLSRSPSQPRLPRDLAVEHSNAVVLDCGHILGWECFWVWAFQRPMLYHYRERGRLVCAHLVDPRTCPVCRAEVRQCTYLQGLLHSSEVSYEGSVLLELSEELRAETEQAGKTG